MTSTSTHSIVTMAQLKAGPATGQYFRANVPTLIRALRDTSHRVHALASALTGAALERAQSGNTPALAGADSALDTLKGKAKGRVDAALSHVRGIDARAGKAFTVPEYDAFADATFKALIAILTPEVKTPGENRKVNYRALYEACHKAHSIALSHVAELVALLEEKGIKAPAIPADAALVNVPGDALDALI
jgi:hypothetical protein